MKHWIFDLDGTLVDSFKSYLITLDKIFTRHGRPFEAAVLHDALTIQLPVFFKNYLGQEKVQDAMDELHELSLDDAKVIRPFKGIEDALDELRGRSSLVAIWTNRDLVSANLILEHSGVSRYVDAIVSGTCVVKRKPDPEGLHSIVQKLKCEPGQAVMVGDHEHDVLGAKAAGALAVRASWHGYWQPGACSVADHQFFEVEEFNTWIRSPRFQMASPALAIDSKIDH